MSAALATPPAATEEQAAPLRLVCFAPAGGSSASFKTWPKALAPEFLVQAVDLPGRATRRADPPAESLVQQADELAPRLAGAGPYALLGHSLGGLLAYEVAKRISRDPDLRDPEFVVLAGSRPPHRSSSKVFAPLVELPDEQLLDALTEIGAVNPMLRTSPLRGLFVPALRNDLRLVVGYHPDPAEEPPRISLAAWHAEDDHLAPPAVGTEWARYTSGDFTHTAFGGDHFFLYDRMSTVASALRAARDRAARPLR